MLSLTLGAPLLIILRFSRRSNRFRMIRFGRNISVSRFLLLAVLFAKRMHRLFMLNGVLLRCALRRLRFRLVRLKLARVVTRWSRVICVLMC